MATRSYIKPLIFIMLSVFSASILPAAFADSEQCLKAVQEKRYERLGTVCLDLPHRDRLKKMQMLMSGQFEHYLGTIEAPAPAFELLHKLAKNNDRQAQYMYGYLYKTIHTESSESWTDHPSNDGSITILEHNAKIRAEAEAWVKRAAEGGHTMAMLEIAESELLKSYTKPDIDLTSALQIATQANQSNPVLAKDLISRIKKRISEYN